MLKRKIYQLTELLFRQNWRRDLFKAMSICSEVIVSSEFMANQLISVFKGSNVSIIKPIINQQTLTDNFEKAKTNLKNFAEVFSFFSRKTPPKKGLKKFSIKFFEKP